MYDPPSKEILAFAPPRLVLTLSLSLWDATRDSCSAFLLKNQTQSPGHLVSPEKLNMVTWSSHTGSLSPSPLLCLHKYSEKSVSMTTPSPPPSSYVLPYTSLDHKPKWVSLAPKLVRHSAKERDCFLEMLLGRSFGGSFRKTQSTMEQEASSCLPIYMGRHGQDFCPLSIHPTGIPGFSWLALQMEVLGIA